MEIGMSFPSKYKKGRRLIAQWVLPYSEPKIMFSYQIGFLLGIVSNGLMNRYFNT
jgi:hypothetical protein